MSAPPVMYSPRPTWLELAQSRLVSSVVGATGTAAMLVAGVAIVNAVAGATTQAVLTLFLVNLLVVLGLQVFTSNSGIVSFGHSAFMAIGAYAGAIASTSPALKALQIPHAPGLVRHAHLSFVSATSLAALVACAVALPIGWVFVRLTGAAGAIGTLAWLIIVQTIIGNWQSLTNGTATFYGIPATTTVWTTVVWAIPAIVVARVFRESGLGLGLRASSADEFVAAAIGVNVRRARLAAWVLSAGLAGVGGSLYAHYTLALAPDLFGFSLTFLFIVMTIVGGRSVSGAVLGAAIISVVEEGLRRGENASGLFGLSTLVLAGFFFLMIVVRPSGLLGRYEIDELRTLRPSLDRLLPRLRGPHEGRSG